MLYISKDENMYISLLFLHSFLFKIVMILQMIIYLFIYFSLFFLCSETEDLN